jgi:magnesium-protoporphyrin O-methyltransferase
MMETSLSSTSYQESRARLETYFDKTARKAWEDLTSDVPVSGIRATVRAGRDQMRALLLSTLPADMRGLRLLDAGCGTGALAIAAAERGAEVVAIDVSQGLIAVAHRGICLSTGGWATCAAIAWACSTMSSRWIR